MQITTIRKEIEISNLEIIKLNQSITTFSAKLITSEQKIREINEKNKSYLDIISNFEISISQYKQLISSKDI